jgi:anti-sigma regulatory factor (Ser/Thr protein kinase)
MRLRRARLAFVARRESVPTARGFAVCTSTSWGYEAMRDDMALLVTELVTNAVLHGAPPITLRVECDGTRLRVSVTDRNSDPAYVRDAGPEDESGRGMRLVQQLARAWGVIGRLDGKAVWFELAGAPG